MINLRFVSLTQWPGEPTKNRQNAAFKSDYSKTLRLLEYELKKIDARNVIVQAFFREDQIRNDGWPRANLSPSQPGVILSFSKPYGPVFVQEGRKVRKVMPLSFPCDTYTRMEHNLHAIALSLAALRAVDRYGVTHRSEQYSGWKQIDAPLPGGFASREDAAAYIAGQAGLDPVAAGPRILLDAELRRQTYRDAARLLHPDAQNGSHELFVRLQQALAAIEGKTAGGAA